MLFPLKVIWREKVVLLSLLVCLSGKAFKRCVTTFLSRERECDDGSLGQGNWSIMDKEVRFDLLEFVPV